MKKIVLKIPFDHKALKEIPYAYVDQKKGFNNAPQFTLESFVRMHKSIRELNKRFGKGKWA